MSTTETHAIYFAHEDSLIDFVRQYGRSEPQGRFDLFICREPADQPHDDLTPTRYFLARRDRPVPSNPSYTRVTIQIDGDVVRSKGHIEGRFDVAHTRTVDRLPALLGPVRDDGEHNPTHVILWTESEETFQGLVTMSLRLGCDRLQATAIVAQHPTRRVLLLRADHPSYFVVDLALSQDNVEVFSPLDSGSLYVPWGTTHPLAELWQTQKDHVFFMRGMGPDATMSAVSLPQWGDIYGLTQFALDDFAGDESWDPGNTPIEHFQVQLQLVPSHQRREAHLWMMPISQQSHLERLLHLIPESDLDVLLFAVQESPTGEKNILIRERHTGAGRQYIDFEGLEFAPYAGYPNLMLPVDQDLEPALRKDRYRRLFDLKTGKLTLVWRDGSKIRVTHMQERTFKPLTGLVDYLIGTGSQSLQSILQRTIFDFQRFETAPRRPVEAATAPKPKAAKPDRPVAKTQTQNNASTPEEVAPAVQQPQVELVYEQEDAANQNSTEEDTNALQEREAEIEETIILDGQTVAAWTELAGVKLQLNKPGEAALCWQEAAWLTFAEEQDPSEILKEVSACLEARPDISLATLSSSQKLKRAQAQAGREDSAPAWIWLYLQYGAKNAQKQDKAALRQWLTDSYKLLSKKGTNQRTKVRWMLWNLLLGINKDSTQEVKVREGILDSLTKRGLQSFEAPSFIRNRVYQSRFLQEQDGESDNELQAAVVILEAIQGELDRAQDLALSRVSTSILAYAYERLGNRGQSQHFFQQAEAVLQSPTGLTPIERAWMTLYLGATSDLRIPGTGKPWVDRYNDLLRMPSNQGLARSELEVLQKSIFRRTHADNPTEFFSPENFRTFFSAAGNYDSARQIRDSLERHIQRGKFAAALRELKDLAARASSGRLDFDDRPFAWLLGPIVNILRRIGQTSEGINILRKFEDSIDKIPRRTRIPLYQKLFRLKLAEGFLELGEEEHGSRIITDVVRETWQNRDLVWLDHLDMLGAALEAVEASPLHQRPDAVREVLSALFITNRHPQDSEQYRPVKLRLLDHCVEVALSKEKLSLRRYKSYLDEDEFHVRYRVVNETLAS